MRTSHHHEEPRDPDALRDMGYQPDNVSIKHIRGTSIAFTGLMIFTILIVGAWYWLLGPGSRPLPGLVGNRQMPSTSNPSNPLLQSSVTTKTDIMTIRRDERNRLTRTEYLDREKGIVRIPIDRAMDVVASGQHLTTGSIVPARKPTEGATGGTNLTDLRNESNLPNPPAASRPQTP